jgi:predicted GNAT superfamily acetyltransferase
MNFEITDVTTTDLVAVLALNESEVPHLGKVNIEQMHWFASNAAYFRVAKSDERLAAFLVGLRPDTDYASLNYRWFCDRYEDFAYIDRVAVAAFARRHGLASRLYDDFAASMPDSVKSMTCEVNVRPPNDDSMRFHTRLGFREVGTQVIENGSKEVALLLRELG